MLRNMVEEKADHRLWDESLGCFQTQLLYGSENMSILKHHIPNLTAEWVQKHVDLKNITLYQSVPCFMELSHTSPGFYLSAD